MSSPDLPIRPEADLSFAGDSVRLEGALRFAGKFLLDGRFEGEIEGSGRLELGSSAQAEGRISVEELVHHGSSEGDLVAVDKLDLRPGCYHRGDIQALRVQISPKTCLEGVLKMPDSRPDPPQDPTGNRNRKKLMVGIFVLFLVGAGAPVAIQKVPLYLQAIEERLSRFGRLIPTMDYSSAGGVPEKDDDVQDELLEKAIRFERNGIFPMAVTQLAKAAKVEGVKTPVARFRLAKNFARLGRSDDAIAQLVNLLKKTPDHIEGRVLLGDLYARAESFQKAAFAYAEAIRFDPADVVLRRRLEKVRVRLREGKPAPGEVKKIPSLEALLSEAEELLGGKKPVQAAKILRKGISLMSEEPRLYFQLGSALTEISNRDGAIDAYKKVIDLAPDWLDAYSRLGALLEAGRRYKEAVVLYRRAAALHPSNLEMLVRIARLERARRRPDEAYKLLLKMRKKHPKSKEILLELGMLLWESGKAKESKEHFREVLKIEPNSAPALNRLAWFHVVDGKNLEHGIELSKRSLEIRPDTPPYLDTLAEIYFRNKQPVKSIPLIQRAIELEPSNRYYRVQLDKFKRASR